MYAMVIKAFAAMSSLLLGTSQAITAVEVWPAGRTTSINTGTSGYVSHYCPN